MKKILVIMMALMMVLLTACASQPAAEPTAAPTEVATEAPTEAPTEEPTEVPTEEPTEEPTEVPTEEPTEEPTEVPTEEPTEEPTAEPTEEPVVEEVAAEEPAAEEATEAVEETTEAVEEVPAEEATEVVEEPVAEETTEAVEETAAEETTAVMSYEEYAAAELKSAVTVETYVQDKQGWWDNKVTVYTQDENGGYFLYNMACSQEDAEKLVPGTKIRVSGTKDAWAGEVEIIDIKSMEILEAEPYIAEALDVTALLGTDELINKQNMKVAFKGMTIEPSTIEGDETEYAFLYNWDGSGMEGSDSDLYFNASINGQTYSFVIEYYLTGADSAAYQAVQNLKVGDKVDLEGFLYWYEGSQPHITSVVAAAE